VASKLYGISGSRAIRSIWAAEEVGLDYEHVPTHFAKEAKSPEYLAINPNGRIPALVEGDFVLFESMAINLYLAKKYGGDLYPRSAEGEASAFQWSLWGISEIEPLQMQIVVQKFFTPEEKFDARVVARSEKGLKRPLDVLEATLAKRDCLLGDRFTIADLNVSAVMLLLEMVAMDLSGWPNVSAWLERCYSRDSLAKARARA
jgi:glutathione S-transferase